MPYRPKPILEFDPRLTISLLTDSPTRREPPMKDLMKMMKQA